MWQNLTHRALRLACWQSDFLFRHERNDLERVQRRKLSSLLFASGYTSLADAPDVWERFRNEIPLTRYPDWADRIAAQREDDYMLTSSPVVRYQPTSGSSQKLKMIPYTRAFLDELDAAIGPWVSSMYRMAPGLKRGTHYWSVSWLPESQRGLMKGNLNDDSQLLGFAKRMLSAGSQAVPAGVAMAARADDALFATLAYLVARKDLSLLSVWSPTFALQLLDKLVAWRLELAEVLYRGHWGARAESLKGIKAPRDRRRAVLLQELSGVSATAIGPQLWPSMAMVSAWGTADSEKWAQQLRGCFPSARFEGKGLWATEGVVTIPYHGLFPLAYRSHVYEFEDLSTGRIKAPWELREGDEVSPVISAGNGLLRYCMDDALVVTRLWGQVPCLSFLGRRYGVDMVGEKMSPDAARSTMADVGFAVGLEPVCLLASDDTGSGLPGYVALFSGSERQSPALLSERIEQRLRKYFHYDLARDLGQLAAARVLVMPDGWAGYEQLCVAGGMIAGNIKPEPVRRLPSRVLREVLPPLSTATPVISGAVA